MKLRSRNIRVLQNTALASKKRKRKEKKRKKSLEINPGESYQVNIKPSEAKNDIRPCFCNLQERELEGHFVDQNHVQKEESKSTGIKRTPKE